mmetsp:Transcript_15167/g.39410  ORF Transcript_15167/g.39410 Transcript_15167/m.39410 type:complete len:249 (-) Transcript_15167:17-763(-)
MSALIAVLIANEAPPAMAALNVMRAPPETRALPVTAALHTPSRKVAAEVATQHTAKCMPRCAAAALASPPAAACALACSAQNTTMGVAPHTRKATNVTAAPRAAIEPESSGGRIASSWVSIKSTKKARCLERMPITSLASAWGIPRDVSTSTISSISPCLLLSYSHSSRARSFEASSISAVEEKKSPRPIEMASASSDALPITRHTVHGSPEPYTADTIANVASVPSSPPYTKFLTCGAPSMREMSQT